MKTFNLQSVLEEKISEVYLHGYLIGYDLGKYRLDAFADCLLDGIVDFAFGYNTGILDTYDRRKLKEAAQSLYKIKGYEEAKCIYLDNDGELPAGASDEVKKIFADYEAATVKKGEFGELLLHVILRDYFNTVPLLSKIYFKDTDGFAVHGFDAVHIGPDINDNSKDSLYLGESKIYATGEGGVKALVGDIKDHYVRDFLDREFVLVSKKKDAYTPIATYVDKNTKDEYSEYLSRKDKWMDELKAVGEHQHKLQDLLGSVTIPLICTYESELFKKYANDGEGSFAQDYEAEVRSLKAAFDEDIKKIPNVAGEPEPTTLNMVLLLLPIPSKEELIKILHKKAWYQQNA